MIRSLAEQYAYLHTRSSGLLEILSTELLYLLPRQAMAGAPPIYSCGEHLLRSAAAVEQTFGGITTNLWDDPFEWTLPETLKTRESVREYLAEVEATRLRGFALFSCDRELYKEINLPSGEMQTLGALFIETLARAAHHQGRAFATFKFFSDRRLPGV